LGGAQFAIQDDPATAPTGCSELESDRMPRMASRPLDSHFGLDGDGERLK
jgi:hypothetical protein